MEAINLEPHVRKAASNSVRATPALEVHGHVHPLDPLSGVEIERAAKTARRHAAAIGAGELRFNAVQLKEPAKSQLLRFQHDPAALLPRLAVCTVILPASQLAVECTVELSRKSPAHDNVQCWRELPGLHPMTTPDDNNLAEEVMKADPTIRRLLEERYGITNMDNVACDTWACHNAPAHLNNRRLMQGFLYGRACPGDNEYAHPLDLSPIVDLNDQKVVHIDMAEGEHLVHPKMPSEMVNYHQNLQTQPWRTDIKPLHIIQPLGPSFVVEGNLVKWQKWHIRIGFNAREGLVLHQVAIQDQGRLRPVLHRMSLAEMAVPYGDPNYIQARKSAFDVGDYGFGFCANSLQLGCDCLGHIKYFDGLVNDSKGDPVVIKNAICLHEEDAGIMWKHVDVRTGHVEVRRARKLVFQQISTFMNYEYILSYNFFQDGHIAFEAKLSGILSTSLAPHGEDRPSFGVRVAPGVNATVHQHFFCVRIDPSIDDPDGGRNLIVSEVEARPLPQGPANPYSNAFVMQETDLLTTGVAQRDVNFGTARCWTIKNPAVLNPVSGEPVAYKLLPGPTPSMHMGPDSLVYKRAKFATKNLWVTPYDDDQLFPAGNHVVQSTTCMGLAEWTKEDKSLVGADPVIWYSFGLTHDPRVEDFPVMPVEIVGFSLKPKGFFNGNPTLDIPPSKNALSVEYARREAGAPGQACCPVSAARPAPIVSKL